jgi:hypothetical protein
MKKLLKAIALFFDERSMIAQLVIGAAEINVCETIHMGVKTWKTGVKFLQ